MDDVKRFGLPIDRRVRILLPAALLILASLVLVAPSLFSAVSNEIVYEGWLLYLHLSTVGFVLLGLLAWLILKRYLWLPAIVVVGFAFLIASIQVSATVHASDLSLANRTGFSNKMGIPTIVILSAFIGMVTFALGVERLRRSLGFLREYTITSEGLRCVALATNRFIPWEKVRDLYVRPGRWYVLEYRTETGVRTLRIHMEVEKLGDLLDAILAASPKVNKRRTEEGWLRRL